MGRLVYIAMSLIVAFATVLSSPEVLSSNHASSSLRLATVADSIALTTLTSPAPIFSPNGENFVLVTSKGNLEKNTNDYSLLLYKSEEAFDSPEPDVLLTLSSSSNRRAIDDVRWMEDNQTILFLDAPEDQSQQVFSFDTQTRQVIQRTRCENDVVAFEVVSDPGFIAFLARRQPQSYFDQKSSESGLLITDQLLTDLLMDQKTVPAELFIQRAEQKPLKISSGRAYSAGAVSLAGRPLRGCTGGVQRYSVAMAGV